MHQLDYLFFFFLLIWWHRILIVAHMGSSLCCVGLFAPWHVGF